MASEGRGGSGWVADIEEKADRTASWRLYRYGELQASGATATALEAEDAARAHVDSLALRRTTRFYQIVIEETR